MSRGSSNQRERTTAAFVATGLNGGWCQDCTNDLGMRFHAVVVGDHGKVIAKRPKRGSHQHHRFCLGLDLGFQHGDMDPSSRAQQQIGAELAKWCCVFSNMSFSNGDVRQRTQCGENPARLKLVTRSGVEESQDVQGFRHEGRGLSREDRIKPCPSRHPLYWSLVTQEACCITVVSWCLRVC